MVGESMNGEVVYITKPLWDAMQLDNEVPNLNLT